MEIIGPLLKLARGFAYILVINDRFSQYTRMAPLRSTSAGAIADVYLENLVYAYEIPLCCHTDSGPQFAAKLFSSIARMVEMKQLFTTAYHPETNDQAERFNKTIA